jgi:hypothetical protein
MQKLGRKPRPFESGFRTALHLLANGREYWDSKDYILQRHVHKMTFADRLRYSKYKGLLTPQLSLPFKVLVGFGDALCPEKIGGEGGIRTLDELLTHTPLAGERLRPLGHLSSRHFRHVGI